MQRNLLRSISAQVKRLDRGGYARVYRNGGREYATSLHALVGTILRAVDADFKTNQPVLSGKPSPLVADFVVGDRVIFIGRIPSAGARKRLAAQGKKCVVISESALRSDVFDGGVRVSLGGLSDGRFQTIFLDDPSFNFDYAHILPKTEKCSVMHGHTSSALVEIIGIPRDGMVVDFNDAKPVIKDAISALDHKLFIDERYVTERGKKDVSLAFETVHGRFEMKVPSATTVLMRGEATVENMARELLERIAPRMPDNVVAVGVYVYEGLNKGTHLLAQVHAREAEARRQTR